VTTRSGRVTLQMQGLKPNSKLCEENFYETLSFTRASGACRFFPYQILVDQG